MPMVSVTFYTRPGCHLCDDAKSAMLGWASPRGISLELREVNIDIDPTAHERFWLHIPVGMIGEVEAFRHRFDPERFETALRGTEGETRDSTIVDELANRHCIPCRGGVAPLRGEALISLLGRLGGGWMVEGEHHLAKVYRFPDFATALAMVNRIGEVAEAEGHHPDLELAWGRVGVTIWTHAIDGLTESDFVLAAKIDQLAEDGRKG